jgi:hypothetical protein
LIRCFEEARPFWFRPTACPWSRGWHVTSLVHSKTNWKRDTL